MARVIARGKGQEYLSCLPEVQESGLVRGETHGRSWVTEMLSAVGASLTSEIRIFFCQCWCVCTDWSDEAFVRVSLLRIMRTGIYSTA